MKVVKTIFFEKNKKKFGGFRKKYYLCTAFEKNARDWLLSSTE